ncbi:MAG: hypothetical protein IJ588_01795 [Prevotella sp.]|nr:hypothetical protein [Prevotella sp.]
MKIWRIMLMTLAAFSLASCSSDDDEETVSGRDVQRALFEMKNNYSGELRYGQKDKADRQTLKGYTARSAEGLTISLPLEPIAEQVKDATIAQKIRTLGYAEVYATYQFEAIEKGGDARFVLQPQMVADERMATPLKGYGAARQRESRTQPVTYSGLTLLFTGTYTGNFVKENEALVFNICVGQVLIDNEPLEGFQPVVYTFQGNAQYAAAEEREETQVEKEHRQQTDYALQGVWFLDEQELIATNLIGEGVTRYDRSQSGYCYDFYNSHFTIRHFDNAAGKDKLVANGTYTIRYDEKTGDTTLRLYTYATETSGPSIIFQFTVYKLSSSDMELRTHGENSETIYKLSRWER